jgi:two-component system, NarL family, nitrate/nitrite response regulator NarL
MQVVAPTGDADLVAPLLREHRPDLLVLDLRMPSIDGLTLTRRLRLEGIDTPILILTMSDAEEDMAASLHAAARGEMVVAPMMTLKLAQMLQSGAKGDTRSSQFVSLTERERQILEHLSRGQSNKTIARALDISHDTVKLHVRHILSKPGLSSRVEAAVFAVEFRGTPAGAAQAGEAARKTVR